MIIGAFDIEHSKDVFRPWEEGFYITCIHMMDSTGHRETLWVDHVTQETDLHVVEKFQTWLNGLDMVSAHNLKHDMNIMRYLGADFEHVQLHCTMVTEYLLSGQDVKNRRFNLNDVCLHYGMEPKKDVVRTEYWEKGVDTYDVPADILEEYVKDDTEKAYELCERQRAVAVEQKQTQLIKLHNEFALSLSDMELNGFLWDTEKAKEIHDEYRAKVAEVEESLFEIAGTRKINFGSSTQLAAFLFGGGCTLVWHEWTTKEVKSQKATKYYEKKHSKDVKFRPIFRLAKRHQKTKGGVPKTDKNTIKELPASTKQQKKVKMLLLRRSEYSKVADTLIGQKGGLQRKVQKDGRIHSKFNQSVTATGRLSSSDPNGQNFPRGSTSPIKTCIIPTLDKIAQVDLSQVEWKGAGEVSNDKVMVAEINSGIDQHSASCTELMEQELTKDNRTDAKIFNFRMIYGGTHYGYYMDTRMPNFSLSKWKRIVSTFNSKYVGLANYNARNIETVLKGGQVLLFTGRRFVFNKTLWKDGIWQYNERQIKNFPVQGLAGGDLLPLVCCMIRRGMKKMKLKSKLFITVHDSIGFDALKSELGKLHALCMNVADNLAGYIKAYWGYTCKVKNWGGDFEVGPNYGELKEWEAV